MSYKKKKGQLLIDDSVPDEMARFEPLPSNKNFSKTEINSLETYTKKGVIDFNTDGWNCFVNSDMYNKYKK